MGESIDGAKKNIINKFTRSLGGFRKTTALSAVMEAQAERNKAFDSEKPINERIRRLPEMRRLYTGMHATNVGGTPGVVEREARLAHARIQKLNPLYPNYNNASIARMAQRNTQLKDTLSKINWHTPMFKLNVSDPWTEMHYGGSVGDILNRNALKAAVIKRRKEDLLANTVKGFLKRRHPTGFPGTLPDSLMDSLVPYVKNDRNAMAALRLVSKHEKETVNMHSKLPAYKLLHDMTYNMFNVAWERLNNMPNNPFIPGEADDPLTTTFTVYNQYPTLNTYLPTRPNSTEPSHRRTGKSLRYTPKQVKVTFSTSRYYYQENENALRERRFPNMLVTVEVKVGKKHFELEMNFDELETRTKMDRAVDVLAQALHNVFNTRVTPESIDNSLGWERTWY